MKLSLKNRRIPSACIAALLGLGSFSGIAAADCGGLQLEGSQEVPAVQTEATGSGDFKIHNNGTVTGSVTTTGVEGTAAHIHIGAEGVNGPPILTLIKKGDKYSAPPNAKLTEAQQQSFQNGELYVNVHSAEYPNGEIRDQLLASSSGKDHSMKDKGQSMKDKGHASKDKGHSSNDKQDSSDNQDGSSDQADTSY